MAVLDPGGVMDSIQGDGHNELAAAFVRRIEKRYNMALSEMQWPRAYPYDPRPGNK